MIKHRSPISGVDAYEDKWVVSAGYDNQVILWDAKSGEAIAKGSHDHLANQCRFSPCGRYLASASSDYSARLWKLPEMQLISVMGCHDDDVEMVSFSPDGMYLATASRDRCVRLFDLTGRMLQKFVGHKADVISVEWDQTGSSLISSSDDGSVRNWSVSTGMMTKITEMDGVETDTIAIGGNGLLFAGNDAGEICVIDGHDLPKIKAHNSGIKRLVYNQSNETLVSLSYDRKVKIWDVSDINCIFLVTEADLPSEIWPRSCAFLNEDTLVFSTFGSSYASYSISQNQWKMKQVHDTLGINAVAEWHGKQVTVGDAGIVTLDGVFVRRLPSLCNFLLSYENRIVTGGQTGTLFDAISGEVLYQHKSPLNCAAHYVISGEHHVVVGTYTGEGVVIRDSTTGIQLVSVIPFHENAIKGLATDGKTIFSVCATGAAAAHAVSDLTQVTQYEDAHDKIANGCACVGQDCFVSISRDLKLRIWSEMKALVVDTPHLHSIKCISVSKNKKYVAAGSYDGCVAIYSLENKTWLPVTRPTTSGISSICPGIADDEFWASSYDGCVYTILAAGSL